MKSRVCTLMVALVAMGGIMVGGQNRQAANAAAKPAAKPAAKAETAKAAPAPAPAKADAKASAHYGGTETCKMCHPDIYKDWAKTAHAKTFDLLVNVGKEKDPSCLPCHTTGYGKGGYVDEASTPGLKGTTCEACHGPGADHNGDKTKIQRVPSGSTCAACHQNTNIHSLPSM